MATITVNAPTTTEAIEAALTGLAAELRENAYFRFEERQRHSCAVDDWLEAERRLVVRPAFGIEERGLDIRITSTEMPEFTASELRVEVLPNALFILGCHEGQDPSCRRRLAARVDLLAKLGQALSEQNSSTAAWKCARRGRFLRRTAGSGSRKRHDSKPFLFRAGPRIAQLAGGGSQC